MNRKRGWITLTVGIVTLAMILAVCDYINHTQVVEASTIQAKSCSQDDVQAAINSAGRGDTVRVPSGSCEWASEVRITRGLHLLGAGIGNTTIARSSGSALIVEPDATAISNREIIEIAGFSWDAKNVPFSGRFFAFNGSNTNTFKWIKVHHNRFSNMPFEISCLGFYGAMFGVIYSNEFDRVGFLLVAVSGDWHGVPGDTRDGWHNYQPALGDENRIYFENNRIYASSSWDDNLGWIESGQGFPGITVRYNEWDSANVVDQWIETWDVHGLQTSSPPGTAPVCEQYSTISAEYYGNLMKSDEIDRVMLHRGSWLMMFNNVFIGSSWFGLQMLEYGCNSCAAGMEGYPQQINNTYVWNNRRNNEVIDIEVNSQVDYCTEFPLSVREDISYFNHNPSCTEDSCLSGVGCGSETPTGPCAVGVGYWKTSQSCSDLSSMAGVNPKTPISGTFYKCTAPNTWEAHYTPYAYPHPLRGEAALVGDVNADGLVDKADVQACISHILGTQDWGEAADVNVDGKVNVLDVQMIINILSKESNTI